MRGWTVYVVFHFRSIAEKDLGRSSAHHTKLRRWPGRAKYSKQSKIVKGTGTSPLSLGDGWDSLTSFNWLCLGSFPFGAVFAARRGK